ncbi:MAG TPA: hypothetical protein ENJ82_06885, partial [Bacteroidetes bacterium]|nr:hypothetical protein [Bacteroidota bacterium]
MKRLHFYLLLSIAVLTLLPSQLDAQADAKVDERARELVSLGKKYFRTHNYLDAGLSFELATQRPKNRLSTYSWYMKGLSYFKLVEYKKANDAFNKLLHDYPKTEYAKDARYHKSIMLMRSEKINDRERGLDQLFVMLNQANKRGFQVDIEETIRHFLHHEFDQEFLDLYIIFAKPAYKVWFLEATCARLDEKGNGYSILEKLKSYEEEGGTLTAYLADLKAKYESGKRMRPNQLNIAIFLSFNLHLLDTANAVPEKSRRALELYEGMRLALDSISQTINKRINVAVFDTQSDTIGLATDLDSLERFQPDLIIGDIRTSLASRISAWAEAHHTIHIIPRNPLNELIKDKKYTFLAHPSLHSHGAEMARYLLEMRGKRNILVFNDQSYFSSRFAKAFIAEVDSFPGATVVEKIVPRKYKPLRDQLVRYLKTLKYQNYDAIYIPLSSEEAAGLIISQLNYYKIKTQVIGGPDWEMFSVIDPEIKSAYNLEYSTFYCEKNDSVGFDELYQHCLREYGYRPSQYTVQGYDIMAWVLNTSKEMNAFTDPVDVIRNAPNYHGIHQDFYFGDAQDNQ